ncbi:MAG: hypothetical protein ACRDRH_28935 [Pseudonocardia sp.]
MPRATDRATPAATAPAPLDVVAMEALRTPSRMIAALLVGLGLPY